MIEISFIIPVYNVEFYIEKCLSEFRKIKNQNCEFIIVNDGSQDSTIDICERYVRSDKRFRLINKSNEGVSVARNIGLKNAKGNWICFCDGDDWITEKFGDYLFSILDNDFDVICFGTKKVYSEKENGYFPFENNSSILEKEDIKFLRMGLLNVDLKKFINYSGKSIKFVSVWGKLFNHRLISQNNVHFEPEVVWAEDLLFVFDAFRYAKRILCLDVAGYNYRIQNQSAMNSFKEGKRYQMLKMVRHLFKKIESNNEQEFLECAYLCGIKQFLYALKLDICNSKNRNQYNIRKKEFIELKHDEYFDICFKNGDINNFRFEVKLISELCKYNLFRIIDVLFRIKEKKNQYKMQ